MPNSKKQSHIFESPLFHVAGILFLLVLAGLLFCFIHANNNQAMGAMMAQIRFEGEYRIGDGQWQAISPGQHISATKGDVTLRGNFHMYLPSGEYLGVYSEEDPLAFYIDHINLCFFEADQEPHIIDHENPLYGFSACGVNWYAHSFTGDGTESIVIVIHNPHRFGNGSAIDEMLANLTIWGNIDFERDVLESGQGQRNIGLFFIMVSFVMLGSALFSALVHIPNSRIIWLLGITILSAGVYLTYSTPSVPIWSSFISFNTTVLGASMMFYMLFVAGIITSYLNDTKRIGYIATAVTGLLDGLYFVLPVLTDAYYYDTWFAWCITQSLADVVLLGCIAKETFLSGKRIRMNHLGLAMLVIAFEIDVIVTATGRWEGGFVSKYVFLILFAAALILLLRIIPESINAAERAEKLEMQRSRLLAEKNMMEAELKESRISIMLSQIQPHFIYNTLGTIERMCLKDPQRAFELVRNFSLYLRGNFSEIDSVTPIRFSEELKHVEYYVNIEKVRFPDMSIEYEVEITDFVLPALSVQPLVENAIKHGLMRLESGGTVVIRSYETSTHYCVEIKDDGVGFDTSLPIDEKKHVGIRNIRGRLKAMVDGELILTSKVGEGTKAVIMIPKEVAE